MIRRSTHGSKAHISESSTERSGRSKGVKKGMDIKGTVVVEARESGVGGQRARAVESSPPSSLLANDNGAVGVAQNVGRDACGRNQLLEAPELAPAEDDHVGLVVPGEGEQAVSRVAVRDVESWGRMLTDTTSAVVGLKLTEKPMILTDVDALGDECVRLLAQVLHRVGTGARHRRKRASADEP